MSKILVTFCITYINQCGIYFLVCLRLLKDFDSYTGTAEKENGEKNLLQNKFIDACLDSLLIKETHSFLIEQGKASEDEMSSNVN